MWFGWSITQEIPLRLSPQEAFADARMALFQIGQVGQVDEEKRTLEGSMRYGAQQVQLKIAVAADGDHCVLVVTGTSDDIWRYGAKQGIQQLRAALEGMHGPAATPQQMARAGSNDAPGVDAIQHWGKKLSFPAFLVVVSLGSLVMTQERVPLRSPLMLQFAGVAMGAGAVVAWLHAPWRYQLIAMLSGAVAALSAIALCLLVLQDASAVYRVALLLLAAVGMLPGVGVFLGLKALQDRVFPRQPTAFPSSSEAPRAE